MALYQPQRNTFLGDDTAPAVPNPPLPNVYQSVPQEQDWNDAKHQALQSILQKQSQVSANRQMGIGQTPTPQQTTPPGAVKSYLSNLVYNLGEIYKRRSGLYTDDDKQQMAIHNQQAQQALDTQEGYRRMQEQAISGGLPSPVSPEQANMYKGFGLDVAPGTMLTPKQHVDLMKEALQNKGKTDAATINQGVPVPVTDDMASRYGLKPGSTIGAKAAAQLASLEGKNIETKTQMLNGAPHQVIRNKVTGEVIHDMGIDPTIAINQAKANSMFGAKASMTPFTTFDSDGQLVTISAGQAIASGVPPAGVWNQLYGATGTTKSQGQSAQAVAEHIPEFENSVRSLAAKGQLGAVMGRLNTYLTQGYGGDDKDIAEFVTTVGLIKSGAVRAHFGARGGSQILSKFDSMLNTAQEPNAIIGSADAINSFLQGYGRAASNANAPHTAINKPSAPASTSSDPVGSYLDKFKKK